MSKSKKEALNEVPVPPAPKFPDDVKPEEIYSILASEIQRVMSVSLQTSYHYAEVIGKENVGGFYLSILGDSVATAIHHTFKGNQEEARKILYGRIQGVLKHLSGDEPPKIIVPNKNIVTQ